MVLWIYATGCGDVWIYDLNFKSMYVIGATQQLNNLATAEGSVVLTIIPPILTNTSSYTGRVIFHFGILKSGCEISNGMADPGTQ